MSKIEWLIVAVLILVGGAIVTKLYHDATCNHGHYEIRHVEAHTDVSFITLDNGNSLMPIYDSVPEHDERVWVCDGH